MKITASGCRVRGTGVKGSGMAICAAMAMSALAPTTSSMFAATRPRTRRSITTAGMVSAFSLMTGEKIPKNGDLFAREKNMLRRITAALAAAALLAACEKAEPLTAEKAQKVIGAVAFKQEPVYAEVPQKVWWTPKAPKDDYDEKALRTLRNLQRAGLVTVTEEVTADSATYVAKVTKKGFPILGTAPSARGPVYRAKIAEKVYDGIRDFVRHPTEETVGHAQLIWHYDNPTP